VDEFINYDKIEKLQPKAQVQFLRKYEADIFLHIFPKKAIADLYLHNEALKKSLIGLE